MARAFYIAAGSRRIAFISKMRYMLQGRKSCLFFFYFTNNSGVGRYVQSVSLGGTALLFGLILEIIGLLGEAIRVNQRMLEDVLIRLKNSETPHGSYSHDGLRIYTRHDN